MPHFVNLLRLIGRRTSPRSLRSSERPRRLRLEGLEAREVPAAFAVTTEDDAGPGSLRQAIVDANTLPGPDNITFELGAGAHTIALTGGELELTDSVTVDGPGPNLLTVSGSGGSRVFRVVNGDATATEVVIRDLRIADGLAATGAGIWNLGATLTLNNVVLTANRAVGTTGAAGSAAGDAGSAGGNGLGGGLAIEGGAVTLIRTVVKANAAEGGIGGAGAAGVDRGTGPGSIGGPGGAG